jgi:hypothetical protein
MFFFLCYFTLLFYSAIVAQGILLRVIMPLQFNDAEPNSLSVTQYC